MNSKRPDRRTVILPFPASVNVDGQLRAVFRAAMRQALVPGLLLSMAACGGGALEVGGMAGHGGAGGTSIAGQGGWGGTGTNPGGAGGGPSGQGGSGGSSGPVGQTLACGADGSWDPVAGLLSTTGADYVAFLYGPGSPPIESGTPCAAATDIDACRLLLESVRATVNSRVSCNPGGCQASLIITRGDEVRHLVTRDEVVGFLGAIDSPGEAALVAFFAGNQITCGGNTPTTVALVDGGFRIATQRRTSDCPVTYASVVLLVTSSGQVQELSSVPGIPSGVCIGRRPDGLVADTARDRRWTLQTFLGECASLEASSVQAFVELAADLRTHGAPPSLVRRALASAADEVRHAEVMGMLALRAGAVVAKAKVRASARKPLFALALQNAVEGCVRETFGALAGAFQAENAADAEIRVAMRAIARDEARHAALAWRIAAWVEPRLSGEERTAIADARKAAVDGLRAELAERHADSVHDQAGWPRPAQGLSLCDALDHLLWRARES